MSRNKTRTGPEGGLQRNFRSESYISTYDYLYNVFYILYYFFSLFFSYFLSCYFFYFVIMSVKVCQHGMVVGALEGPLTGDGCSSGVAVGGVGWYI